MTNTFREIKNVALAGATGNVGSHVLNALVDLKFNVTVLTRREGSPFPAGVAVKATDFSSVEALTALLAGQDAVVDATSSMDAQTPLNLIAAAAAAGVYRFIISDFGLDPLNAKIAALPVFARKAASLRAVRAAEPGGLTYTAVATGPFLDWNLRNRMSGIDVFDKKVRLSDEGTHVLPWTTLEAIGRATAAVLLHPKETENRPVYVSSIVKSQQEIVEVAKRALGADGWEFTRLDTDAAFQRAMENFRAGDYSTETFMAMIYYASAKDDYSGPWEKDDNALLGLEPMTDEELEALIKDIVATDSK